MCCARIATIAVFAIPCMFGAGTVAEPITILTHPAMGTEFEVRLCMPLEEASPLAEEVFELIDATEEEISSWRETSATTYVNRHAAEDPVRVPTGLLNLFVQSKRLSEITSGAFDPTVGPLIDLWRMHDGGVVPSSDSIASAIRLVGMRYVVIDESALTIQYEQRGMRVDWGAIGKGYAVDLAIDLLRTRGVRSALVSAGRSTIGAVGAPEGDQGWIVHVPDASGETSQVPPVLLRDAVLSTSSCPPSASRPCDILDPRVGRPSARASSATVIALRGADADGISTALLVMSREETEAFFERFPEYRAVRFDAESERADWFNWGS